MKFVRWSSIILVFVLAVVAARSSVARGADVQNVRLLMNWFIQADQAGFWQAQIDGLGASRGVAVTVIQGGPKIQTIPQVASGQAEFGVANADDLLVHIEENPIARLATRHRVAVRSCASSWTGHTRSSEWATSWR